MDTHRNELEKEEIMLIVSGWSSICADEFQHQQSEPEELTLGLPTKEKLKALANSALEAADELCAGAGSTVIGWRWVISSPILSGTIEVPDVEMSGEWDVAHDDIGQAVEVGSGKGLLGGWFVAVNAAAIEFGPLLLAGTDSVDPDCTRIPLVGDVSLWADADVRSFTALDDLMILSGNGRMCAIPC